MSKRFQVSIANTCGFRLVGRVLPENVLSLAVNPLERPMTIDTHTKQVNDSFLSFLSWISRSDLIITSKGRLGL